MLIISVICILCILIIYLLYIPNKQNFQIANGTIKSHNNGNIIDLFLQCKWKIYIKKELEKYYISIDDRLKSVITIDDKNEFVKDDIIIPIYYYGKFSKQKALDSIGKLPYLSEIDDKADIKYMPMGRIKNLLHVNKDDPLFIYHLIKTLRIYGWVIQIDNSNKSKLQLELLFGKHKLDHYKYFMRDGPFMWVNLRSGDKFTDVLTIDQILDLYYFQM